MKTKFFFLALLAIGTSLKAAEITYKVVKDDDLGTVVHAFGQKPEGATAFFVNEFGDIAGNRYNQIAKDKTATLELSGWEGCTIEAITFNMCSNKTTGGAEVSVTVAEEVLFKQRAAFNDAAWYGEWVGHQNGIYVDIRKEMQKMVEVPEKYDVIIKIKGTESSVYINSFTIEYDEGDNDTENPMGYVYEKIPKNGSLAEGDNVIIYYSGVAASDIIQGENSYLSIWKVQSTSNVFEPELSYFTVLKSDSHWQFVNQYGELLGAVGEKKMIWDEGVTTWDVKFTFDGAEITNTNANYGTIRFNTSTGDRFTTYKSTSQKLPSLYRRVRQNEPIAATSIALPEEKIIYLDQDTAVLIPKILPLTTTDQRVTWESKNGEIATVRDGIVKPVAVGTTEITATIGEKTATCRIEVKEQTDGVSNVKIGGIYAENGRIFGAENLQIFNLLGQDVTKDNGSLKGIYIVKHQKATMKIVVR